MKHFRRKIVIPHLLSPTSFDTRNFLKHTRFSLRSLSVLWEKKFLREIVIILQTSLIHNLFRNRKYSKSRMCYFSTLFANLRQNFADEKSWYPLSSLWHFSIPEWFWETEESLHDFLRSCETKFLTGYRENPSLILCIRFYDTRSFFISGRDTLRNFSLLWDKTISTKNRDSPLSSLTFLEIRTFLKHRRVPSQSFPFPWDKNLSTRNRDTPSFPPHPPPLISENFVEIKIFPKPGRVRWRIYSVLWDEIIVTKNRATPCLTSNISQNRKFS